MVYFIDNPAPPARRASSWRFFFSLFVLVSYIMSIVAASLVPVYADDDEVNERSLPEWVLCVFGGADSAAASLLKFGSTDYLNFERDSKSVIHDGIDSVDSILNGMMSVGAPEGHSFKEVNERILGYPLRGKTPEEWQNEDDPAPTEEVLYNQGPRVNPYERFGYAGLKFSSYKGEWNYVDVKICATGEDRISPMDYAAFYKGRKTPRASFSKRAASGDARSIQHVETEESGKDIADATATANSLLGVTKFLSATTTTLVNLSFGDITKTLGIDKIVSGKDGEGGTVGQLYQYVFVPFVVFGIVITAINMLWRGLVKGQVRQGLGILLRSIFLLILSSVIFAKPGLFVDVPNRLAIIGQAVVVSSMSSGVAGGGGICETESGTNFDAKQSSGDLPSYEDSLSFIDNMTLSLRANVGCQIWQAFVLRPWSMGQFGVPWNKLFAKGQETAYAGNDVGFLEQDNEEWTGTADVPLGGEQFIHNWAIFQISTQTNAHAPIGEEGKRPLIVNGMSADWWRIVDAVSNYSEKKTKHQDINKEVSVDEIDYDKKVSPYWNTWVGNNAKTERVGVATSALLTAIVGLAPLFFISAMAAIASVSLAMLMIFSPAALLLACYGGQGWEIFKAWGERVVNTVIARIVLGLMLSLTILAMNTGMRAMEEIGYTRGFLLMLALSIFIILGRKKIVDSIASWRFSSINISEKNSTRKAFGVFKFAGLLVGGGLMGAASSKKSGGSGTGGAVASMKQTIRNRAQSSNNEFISNSLSQYEDTKFQKSGEIIDHRGKVYCANCGREMMENDKVRQDGQWASRAQDGSMFCMECTDSGFTQGKEVREVFYNQEYDKNDIPDTHAPVETSQLSGDKGATNVRRIIEETKIGRTDTLDSIINDISKSFADASHVEDIHVIIPDELKPFVNESDINLAVAGFTGGGGDVDRLATGLMPVFSQYAEALAKRTGQKDSQAIENKLVERYKKLVKDK